jgi:hypothetical protein
MKPKSTSPARRHVRVIAGCCALVAVTFSFSSAKEPAPRKSSSKAKASAEQKKEEEKSTRPVPTPAEAEKKGFTYLLAQQHENGGWGQGGGWRQDLDKQGSRVEGKNVVDPPDLGNTCISLMALHRAGHSPTKGEHQKAAARGFDFVCTQVELSDNESLYVTSVRDTQLQTKIGPYVDTFLAAWFLSELKDDVPDEMEKRRTAALDKTVKKIEKHQKQDGTFAGNHGWAAVLSQGLCSKALNNIVLNGGNVGAATLRNDQAQNVAGLNLETGDFSKVGGTTISSLSFSGATAKADLTVTASGVAEAAEGAATAAPSDAGISIYRESSKLGGLVERTKANTTFKAQSEAVIADATTTPEAKDQARENLKKIEADDKATEAATKGIASKLGNGSYVAGFGNNGGEEFLSYMNISEAMRAKGGKDWTTWNDKMTTTLCSAQNEDGSWAGHHCITGRTFCTSAALLTLLVERMKLEEPVLSKSDGKEEKKDKKTETEVVPVKAETSP